MMPDSRWNHERNTEFFLKGLDGRIEIINDTVIVTKKSLLTLTPKGAVRNKKIPIKNISSVLYRPGDTMSNGYIKFNLFSEERCISIIIRRGYQSELGRQIKEYIESRMVTSENGGMQ